MPKYLLSSLAGVGLAALVIASAASAENGALPGGATSLREQHGDWTVICGVGKDGEKQIKNCILQQEQVRQIKDGPTQRLLAVEVNPTGQGTNAVFVLPLGLKLEKGAVLQIDDGKASDANPFRTCLLAGCIVNISADDKLMASLGEGKALAVKTMTDDGKDANFSISLNGFQKAFDRAVALQK
jgi:invasion protein IalB